MLWTPLNHQDITELVSLYSFVFSRGCKRKKKLVSRTAMGENYSCFIHIHIKLHIKKSICKNRNIDEHKKEQYIQRKVHIDGSTYRKSNTQGGCTYTIHMGKVLYTHGEVQTQRSNTHGGSRYMEKHITSFVQYKQRGVHIEERTYKKKYTQEEKYIQRSITIYRGGYLQRREHIRNRGEYIHTHRKIP